MDYFLLFLKKSKFFFYIFHNEHGIILYTKILYFKLYGLINTKQREKDSLHIVETLFFNKI